MDPGLLSDVLHTNVDLLLNTRIVSYINDKQSTLSDNFQEILQIFRFPGGKDSSRSQGFP